MRTDLRIVGLSCALCCLLATSLGCGGRDDDFTDSLSLEPPVALKGRLLFVDREGARAFLLDVSGKQLQSEAEIIDLPHDPTLAVRRNGANEALILALGRRATEDEDAEPAALAVIGGNGDVRTYKLGNPFDRLAQSEDGRFALLFKSDTAQRLIDNPNEIAIVDLSKPPKDKDALDLRTLQNLGESPVSVVFSPQMNIVGEDRRLAIVLSHKNVTLIDLDHLDRVETTVQLGAPGGQPVEPSQVAFNPNAPELYVRGAGSNDVFVFNLSARPAGSDPDDDTQHNDFRPFIDQLGVGGQPTDMTLYQTDASARLLVLTAGTLQASVVDASTSGVTDVALPAQASHALLFEAPSPRDREASTRALLFQDGATSLMFVDLADIEDRGSRNVEEVALEQPIARLIALPEEQRVLVMHPDHGVSVVDLANRTVSPLSSATELVDASFDSEQHRLWVGPVGQPRVGWLDLTTGDTHELLLDDDITNLVPMFDSNQLAIVHGEPSGVGYVTVIDAKDPKRETAKSVRGFAIAGLLDRGN